MMRFENSVSLVTIASEQSRAWFQSIESAGLGAKEVEKITGRDGLNLNRLGRFSSNKKPFK